MLIALLLPIASNASQQCYFNVQLTENPPPGYFDGEASAIAFLKNESYYSGAQVGYPCKGSYLSFEVYLRDVNGRKLIAARGSNARCRNLEIIEVIPFDTLLPGELICTNTTSLTLELSGRTETRPTQTGGNSTATITAKVTSGGQPKAGVTVGFAVDVVDNSGGHDAGHTAVRPKGKLVPESGTTDANGEVKVVFQASQVAGEHIIAASCTSCQAAVTHDIKVKVPDLVELFSLPFTGQFAYPGVGETTQHAGNHYLTWDAAYRMFEISSRYKKIWPAAPKLTLNDMSLAWGGKFDIAGRWEIIRGEHAEHRLGENVDIRANGGPGSIPTGIRAAFSRWLDKESKRSDGVPPELVIEPIDYEWEKKGTRQEHFHLRLGN